MTIKDNICDIELVGGLSVLKQRYKINYLPKAVIDGKEYCSKIEFALMMPDKSGTVSYTSLRFTEPGQVRVFIIQMVKAYGRFLRESKPFSEIMHLPNWMGKVVTEKLMTAIKGE